MTKKFALKDWNNLDTLISSDDEGRRVKLDDEGKCWASANYLYTEVIEAVEIEAPEQAAWMLVARELRKLSHLTTTSRTTYYYIGNEVFWIWKDSFRGHAQAQDNDDARARTYRKPANLLAAARKAAA